jgi:hypothetical protein
MKRKFTAFLVIAALLTSLLSFNVFAATYNAEFSAQFNPEINADIGEWPDLGDTAKVTFSEGSAATITIDFGAPVAFGGNYAAVNTDFPFADDVAASITSFKLDGNAVNMAAAYLNNEGLNGGLRLTICNKWNSNITSQPVDVATLGEFSVLEVTFIVGEAAAAPEAAAAAPRTGDSSMIALFGLLFTLSAAGFAVLRARKKVIQ